jgi:hypothetical protein
MVQFNWKGTWLPNLPYNENVVVEYENVNYISITFVPPTDITPYHDISHWDEMLVIFNTPTPTPSITPTISLTPSITPTTTPTPSITQTLTPTPTETITPTPSITPTFTPTPSSTPAAVTGFGYTLVVTPYNPPSSGNTIFPRFGSGGLSGTTNPNTFDINGVYWSNIDNLSIDRTNYYSGMTGNSVTITFNQNGNIAIYSGSPTSITFDTAVNLSFDYNPSIRPNQLILVQSASTNFITGQTVYIGYTKN